MLNLCKNKTYKFPSLWPVCFFSCPTCHHNFSPGWKSPSNPLMEGWWRKTSLLNIPVDTNHNPVLESSAGSLYITAMVVLLFCHFLKKKTIWIWYVDQPLTKLTSWGVIGQIKDILFTFHTCRKLDFSLETNSLNVFRISLGAWEEPQYII